jgi:hypothetical protein
VIFFCLLKVVSRAGLEPAAHWLKEQLSGFHPRMAIDLLTLYTGCSRFGVHLVTTIHTCLPVYASQICHKRICLTLSFALSESVGLAEPSTVVGNGIKHSPSNSRLQTSDGNNERRSCHQDRIGREVLRFFFNANDQAIAEDVSKAFADAQQYLPLQSKTYPVNFLTGSCSEQEPQTSSRFRTDVRTALNRKGSERFGIIAKHQCRPGGSVRTIDPNNP